MERSVKYGTSRIRFSVVRSDRKTLAIEVHPDLSVRAVAPKKAKVNEVKERVLKRALWIKKQQRYFEQFLPRTPRREYVSGETHYYLGRRYVLRVRKSDTNRVTVKGSDLVVYVEWPDDRESVKGLLGGWYCMQARQRFARSVENYFAKFKRTELEKPTLTIRRMSRRWGSCTPSGKIILNPEIIKAPGKCIDYVVVHELCHLIHPNHGSAFQKLLHKVMPDWERWKLRLEKVMS